MEIISRADEIEQILSKKIPYDIVCLILKQEQIIINKETVDYHLRHSPIYSVQDRKHYFFSLKKYRHVLFDKDYQLMNHIRIIGGSIELVQKQRAERIWGSYLKDLRF